MRSFKFLLVSTAYLMTSQQINKSQQPPRSKLLRGEYENKIRRLSPPEKIFDVFATKYIDGKLYMTKKDLINAICFYNYSNCDDSTLQDYHPDTILQFLNKEDNFEIYDYFILTRMVAYQFRSLKQFIKNHNNQKQQMDKQHFKNFMLTQVCKDYDKQIKQGLIGQSRRFKPSTSAYRQRMTNIIENIFKDNRTSISVQELIELRINICRQIFEFDFKKFLVDENGLIDGSDFARSIVKYVQHHRKKEYTKRIKHMPQIGNKKISQHAYIAFHLFIQNNLHILEEQLNRKGALSISEIQNIFKRYLSVQISIIKIYKVKEKVSSEAIQILVSLLDTDSNSFIKQESGFIEKRELLGVLQKLQYFSVKKSGQENFITLVIKDFYKMKQKTKRIIQILNE